MNPLTYLGFTIFSIIMQFCVMEFIHERFQLDKDLAGFNESIHKDDPVLDFNRTPHALFYRTEADNTFNDKEKIKYSNASLEDIILTSTDVSSTSYEVYYENTSIIEDFFTTEPYSTSSEFDNVTEITFFDKNKTSLAKPSVSEDVSKKDNCFCNLLYKKCDINCCCDTDCTKEERSLFINCVGDGCSRPKNGVYFCNSYPSCSTISSLEGFNDLFCIIKVNLPDKRIKSHFQLDVATLNGTFKWRDIQPYTPQQFQKHKYKYGDPLWLLKNAVISSLNLPATITNHYCNGKKQILFLVNESIKCYVKLMDLGMFSALMALEGTKVISFTELSINATVLNCSTLHCTNWTVLACEENTCVDYNKTVHSSMGTDKYFTILAHRMEYTFYYFDSKIINATLKMYLTKIRTNVRLLMQKITVKWYLGNESFDDVIQLSGNPGYIPGLPLIVSPAINNHSLHFYNNTYGKSCLPFPRNVDGKCDWSSTQNKTLVFGLNKRLKCRLNIVQSISVSNATRVCQAIQINIKERLRLNQMLFISPYGNPREVTDDKWVPLEIYDRTFLHGEYTPKNSKLVCYNLVKRYSFIIAYADMNGSMGTEKNKIVKATVSVTYSNVTFDPINLSTVLTIDVRFIDISRPVIEFARAPDLNIKLPSNFFFEYPSNHCYHHTGDIVLLYWCIVLIMK